MFASNPHFPTFMCSLIPGCVFLYSSYVAFIFLVAVWWFFLLLFGSLLLDGIRPARGPPAPSDRGSFHADASFRPKRPECSVTSRVSDR